MQTKNKKLAVLGVSAMALALVVGSVTFGSKVGFVGNAGAEAYDMTLSGSNGAAAVTSLKTNQVTAKTALNNDVAMDYKNCVVADGNVATVKAKGYYGNREPIWAMSKIVVTSNATAGDAVLKYGKTSACLDGSIDLATGSVDNINANFFKVVAVNAVTVSSIKIDFGCDNTDNGFSAMYGKTDNRANYRFIKDGDHYYMQQANYSASHYVDSLIIPDYYGTGDDYAPVTHNKANSSYGLFEKASNVQSVYFPETFKQFGNYFFAGTHNSLTSITYPRDLETMGEGGTNKYAGNAVPSSTSLKTIYFNSKNLNYTPSSSSDYGIRSGAQPNLETVYVSYDVESLPNYLMPSTASSLPSGLKIVYEGTEAEWATLVASASRWGYVADVICSDTVVSSIKFHYSESTLNGESTGLLDLVAVNGKTVSDPGSPVWTGAGNKVFDGWYTAAEGGDKVSFPYTVAGDADFYAHFIDMPSGYSLSDPKAVAVGTYDVVTRADLGAVEYFSYTATQDEVIQFQFTNTVSSQSTNQKAKVYDAAGNMVSNTASSNSAEESVKKVAYLSSGNTTTVKVRFAAGETYTVAYSTYDFNSSYYGTATLTVSNVASAHGDYTAADSYTVGTQATMTDIVEYGHYWYTFTCAEAGTYTFETNNGTHDADKNCTTTLGKLNASGTWVEVARGNNSKGTKFVELEEGVQYYVSSAGFVSTGEYHFSITKGTPDGYGVDNAIALPTNGTEVTNGPSTSYYHNYFRINVETAGSYKLTCDKDVYYQYRSSYTSASSYQYVSIYTTTACAEADMIVAARAGKTDTDKKSVYVDLAVGTYYMKATTYNTATKFSLAAASTVGVTTLNPIEVEMTATTTHLNVTDAAGKGTVYEFTAPTSQWYSFKSTVGYAALGSTYTSSTYLKYFDPSSSCSFSSGGEFHKKLEAGKKYQLFVQGATMTGLDVEITDSIEDGTSKDTAYTYVLGTTEKTTSQGGRIGSTSVYYKFTPAETGEYVVNRGYTSSYSSYFVMYDGDSKLSYTTGSTAYDAVYTLTGGKTYYMSAYTYGFTVIQAGPGYGKGSAIAASITGSTESYEFALTYGSLGTWYTFTADASKWYEFSTTSDATLDVYVGSATTAAASASKTTPSAAFVNEGDVVYLKVSGSVENASFAISHPAAVENGKSFDTAFTYVNDEGQIYMSMVGKTIAANSDGTYCYIKVSVTANTEYVFYSVADSGDLDTINSASTGVVYGADQSAIAADFSDYDIGASDKDASMSSTATIRSVTGSTNSLDFYTRFNSGENTTVYLRYKIKDVDHKLAVRTAAEAWGL